MTSAIFLRGERGDEYVIVLTADIVDPRSRVRLQLFLDELDERTLDTIAARGFRGLAGGRFDRWSYILEQREAVAEALVRAELEVPKSNARRSLQENGRFKGV